jgi:hypothetical protein
MYHLLQHWSQVMMFSGLTIGQLREAYQIAAELVARFGDAHLPVFKRLHKEIQRAEQIHEIKSVALRLASAKVDTGEVD